MRVRALFISQHGNSITDFALSFLHSALIQVYDLFGERRQLVARGTLVSTRPFRVVSGRPYPQNAHAMARFLEYENLMRIELYCVIIDVGGKLVIRVVKSAWLTVRKNTTDLAKET